MADDVRDILKKFPGIVSFEALTFLGDRIGETLTVEAAPVVGIFRHGSGCVGCQGSRGGRRTH